MTRKRKRARVGSSHGKFLREIWEEKMDLGEKEKIAKGEERHRQMREEKLEDLSGGRRVRARRKMDTVEGSRERVK